MSIKFENDNRELDNACLSLTKHSKHPDATFPYSALPSFVAFAAVLPDLVLRGGLNSGDIGVIADFASSSTFPSFCTI